jgi:hypothetical protein
MIIPIMVIVAILGIRVSFGMTMTEPSNDIQVTIAFLDFLALIATILVIPCLCIGAVYFFRKDEPVKESILKSLPANQQPHPWRRYFARGIDTIIVAFIVAALLVMIPSMEFVDQIPDAIHGMAILAIMMPIEAFALSQWKTTPGKWLLGITVTKKGSKALSYSTALYRASLVWLRGEGIGLSLVALFTTLHQYSVLKTKGIVSWDKELGCIMTYDKLSTPRVIGAVLIYIVAIGLSILATVAAALIPAVS